ncbi:MAG: PadR family transcriptional regulator [Pseudonocardia sp.]|nr:PadR family transcriptional regulator [Pseudonocardia sp.]
MSLTTSSAKVLAAFLAEPAHEQYGFGLMRATGVKSGSLYPMLERFERRGWIEGFEESIDEQAAGRPRRRLYRLTGLGEQEARAALVDFYRDLGPVPQWLPGLEGA